MGSALSEFCLQAAPLRLHLHTTGSTTAIPSYRLLNCFMWDLGIRLPGRIYESAIQDHYMPRIRHHLLLSCSAQ